MAFDFLKKLFGIKKQGENVCEKTVVLEKQIEPLPSIDLPFCNECKAPVEDGYQKTAYWNGQKVIFHKYCYRKLKRKAESQIFSGRGEY